MINRAKSLLKAQNTTFIALAAGILIVVSAFGYFFVIDTDYSPRPTKVLVDLPLDKINPQDIQMNRIDGESKLFEQKIKNLEDLLLDTKKREENAQIEKVEMKKEISRLRDDLNFVSVKASQTVLPTKDISIKDPFSGNGSSEFNSDRIYSENQVFLRAPLQEYVMDKPKHNVSHVDKIIPAGTSAKAILVSSVDAICGVYTSNDPIPVKLRIIDDGHLPKGVTAKLKGGIIIASAFGNISNERVYMRLEKMTQVKPNGDFVETEVTGFVSGEDGKFGVRGIVVDKSDKIVRNAAYSGFLGGVANALQAAVANRSIDSWNRNYNVSADVIKEGCVGGTSDAFDMLADYYIKRAEQVQPVIQVNAGRVVDITFTEGTEQGDLHTKERVAAIRNNSRSK